MNSPIVFRLLGMVLWALAGAFLLSFGVGLLLGENWADPAPRAFLISAAIALAAGVLLRLLGGSAELKLFRREALCAIGLSWILASLVGALPYYLGIPGCSFADAVFETTSGLTTTGATAFDDFAGFPSSLLFWRSISQWIGGLGVVVFFVAILSSLGAGAKILFSNESSGAATDFDTARIQHGAFQLMLYYVGLTAACMAAYHLCGLGWFDAVCHAFTTTATGGFSNNAGSIEGYASPALEWAAIVFMAASGTTFLFVLRLIRRRYAAALRLQEVYWYFGILTVAALLLGAFAASPSTTLEQALRAGTFQATSIMTTTGYSSTDFGLWSTPAQVILLMLMIVGGCSGSTGGGVKVVRVVTVARAALRSVQASFRPRRVSPLRVSGRTLDEGDIANVSLFLALTGLILSSGVLVVAILEPGQSFLTVFSAVLASMMNVGPGLDGVGPSQTFAFFSPGSKLYLSLLMILGRLELYAVLVLFMPSVWKRFS